MNCENQESNSSSSYDSDEIIDNSSGDEHKSEGEEEKEEIKEDKKEEKGKKEDKKNNSNSRTVQENEEKDKKKNESLNKINNNEEIKNKSDSEEIQEGNSIQNSESNKKDTNIESKELRNEYNKNKEKRFKTENSFRHTKLQNENGEKSKKKVVQKTESQDNLICRNELGSIMNLKENKSLGSNKKLNSPKTIYSKVSEQMMSDLHKNGRFTYDLLNANLEDKNSLFYLSSNKDAESKATKTNNSKIINDFLERNSKNIKQVLPSAFNLKSGFVRKTVNLNESRSIKSQRNSSQENFFLSQKAFQQEKLRHIQLMKDELERKEKRLYSPKPMISKNSIEIANKLIKNKGVYSRLYNQSKKKIEPTSAKKEKRPSASKVNRALSPKIEQLYQEGVQKMKQQQESRNIPFCKESAGKFYSRGNSPTYNSRSIRMSNLLTYKKDDEIDFCKKSKKIILNKTIKEINNALGDIKKIEKFELLSSQQILVEDFDLNFEDFKLLLTKLGILQSEKTQKKKENSENEKENQKKIDEEDEKLITKAWEFISSNFALKTLVPLKKIKISENSITKDSNCPISKIIYLLLIILGVVQEAGDPINPNTSSVSNLKILKMLQISSKDCIKPKNINIVKNYFFKLNLNKKNCEEEKKTRRIFLKGELLKKEECSPIIRKTAISPEGSKLAINYQLFQQKHQKKIEKKQKEKLLNEMKECTFCPNNKKVDPTKQLEAAERLYSYMSKYNENKKKLSPSQKEKEKEKDKECTFSPDFVSSFKKEMFENDPLKDDLLVSAKLEQYERARIEKKLIHYFSEHGANSFFKIKNNEDLLEILNSESDHGGFRFGIEQKSNKETFDKYYDYYDNYNYLNTGKTPLFTIEVKIKQKVQLLDYFYDDDPKQITEEFCKKYGLGKNSYEKILNVIETKLNSLEQEENES